MTSGFSIPPPGAWPVLFTPFTSAVEVDYDALDALIEFYVEKGIAGLFALCLSGEVFDLSEKERFEVLSRVVMRVRGRIAVVSGANFGDKLEDQARSIDAVKDAGADVPVVLLSLLPSALGMEDQLLRLSDLVSAPMGIYECPVPEHRLLTPEEVGRIAGTGRFVFMKETSRRVDVSGAKIRAAEGTPLQVFQANLRCTPDTLPLGAKGHCGVIANICPEMCSAYCDIYATNRELGERLYESMQIIHDLMISNGYPASGKHILQKRGVGISTVTRSMPPNAFKDENQRAIDTCLEGVDLAHALSNEQIEELKNVIAAANWLD